MFYFSCWAGGLLNLTSYVWWLSIGVNILLSFPAYNKHCLALFYATPATEIILPRKNKRMNAKRITTVIYLFILIWKGKKIVNSKFNVPVWRRSIFFNLISLQPTQIGMHYLFVLVLLISCIYLFIWLKTYIINSLITQSIFL